MEMQLFVCLVLDYFSQTYMMNSQMFSIKHNVLNTVFSVISSLKRLFLSGLDKMFHLHEAVLLLHLNFL